MRMSAEILIWTSEKFEIKFWENCTKAICMLPHFVELSNQSCSDMVADDPFERAVAEQLVDSGYDDLAPYTDAIIAEQSSEGKVLSNPFYLSELYL